MEIVQHPDPILREVSVEVEKPDENVRQLAFKMAQLVHKYNALGLSAPQVGVLQRLIVVKTPHRRQHCYKNKIFRMLNPRIIKAEDITYNREGCLSIPGTYVGVNRHMFISVRYENMRGGTKVLSASGLFAVAIQHEIDHLDGKLIIDYKGGGRSKKLKGEKWAIGKLENQYA